jgi:hypothetical protein
MARRDGLGGTPSSPLNVMWQKPQFNGVRQPIFPMRNRPGRCGGDAVACLVPPERTGREPPDAIDPAPSVPLSRPFVDRVPLQPSPSSSAQALPAAPFLPAGPRSRLWPDAGIQGAAGPSHDRIQVMQLSLSLSFRLGCHICADLTLELPHLRKSNNST